MPYTITDSWELNLITSAYSIGQKQVIGPVHAQGCGSSVAKLEFCQTQVGISKFNNFIFFPSCPCNNSRKGLINDFYHSHQEFNSYSNILASCFFPLLSSKDSSCAPLKLYTSLVLIHTTNQKLDLHLIRNLKCRYPTL